jgi:hypothetical protein
MLIMIASVCDTDSTQRMEAIRSSEKLVTTYYNTRERHDLGERNIFHRKEMCVKLVPSH